MTAIADITGPLAVDFAAAKALVKLFEDIAHNKASISETISTGVTTAKAIAQYVPAATQVLTILEAAQVVDAIYEALPSGWKFIKTTHGHLPPVFGGADEPDMIFGNAIIKG